jgi:hypothetical protein
MAIGVVVDVDDEDDVESVVTTFLKFILKFRSEYRIEN